MVEHLVTSSNQKYVGVKDQEEEMPSERWVMEEDLTEFISIEECNPCQNHNKSEL